MENKPGNAQDSPFGNEKGATMADGPSSGAHNFIKDPESHAPSTGGRDFTKESREQSDGPLPTIDDASIPAGGKLPFGTGDAWSKAEETADGTADTVKHTPFKNLRDS